MIVFVAQHPGGCVGQKNNLIFEFYKAHKNLNHKVLYAAFDLFPTAKGASTHIEVFSKRMFQVFDGGMLFTLGNILYAPSEVEGTIEIKRFVEQIPQYMERANAYGKALSKQIEQMPHLELVHFRDIWSGLASLHPKRTYRCIYEVNGLPSIELPYRYPELKTKTIQKLRQLELRCLMDCDRIIVPSKIILNNLVQLGIAASKISHIPNGASLQPEIQDKVICPSRYLIYFGAVQKWQGLATLLKAMALLKDFEDLKLMVCSSNREKETKQLRKLANKLGIAGSIIWKYQLEKAELNAYIRNAELSIAPLAECSRNIAQGCSPLKVLESMAVGTAVIASDLPVVREIIDPGINGKLVPPDRPQELSRAIRVLLEYPKERKKLGHSGMQKIKSERNWDAILPQLDAVYSQLMATP